MNGFRIVGISEDQKSLHVVFPDGRPNPLPVIQYDEREWLPLAGVASHDGAYHADYRRANSMAIASMGRLK